MGYAANNNNNYYNPIIKTKVSSADKSCIEEDSFIDSLLNFEGWEIEKDIVIMNSNPNLVEKEVNNNNNNKEIDIIIKQQQEEEEEGGVVVCDKLDVLIQQGLDNFSLTSSDAAPAAAADQVVVYNGLESTSLDIKDDVGIQIEVKVDTNNNGGVKKGELDDDEEDDESSSSFSESSSSSGDDDDEKDEEDDDEEEGKKVKGDGGMEEGEIMEEMVAWSDNDEEEEDVVKGPIRSRNEVQLNWISLQSLQ